MSLFAGAMRELLAGAAELLGDWSDGAVKWDRKCNDWLADYARLTDDVP